MIAIDDRNCRPLRPHAVRLLQATTAAGSRNPSPSASAQCAFLRNAWRGYGELASGPISPALKHFQATAKPPPAFDPQESERLLDAAGLARGRDGTRFHLFHDFVPAGEQYEECRLGRESGSALIVLPDTFLAFHYKLIIELAARNRIPTIYPFGYNPAGGGLMSYGPDITDQFRQAAGYVDRILRGEKPADLPVQQSTKVELILNLATAKALGLDVPPTLLALADEVIE